MDDIIILDYDSLCPNHGLFNITYSKEVIFTLLQLELVANDIYGILIIFLSPINIASNIFSAIILLRKELRNPFNVILSIMCIEAAVPLLIKASATYRKMIAAECNVETQTYSMALHDLVVYNSWVPFRAVYTWMTAFLTFLRFRALRSKGKWEASYFLVLSGSVILSAISSAAGIPMYMVNIIGNIPIDDSCSRPVIPGNENVMVPATMWSQTFFDNDCLLFNLNQLFSGIFHNTLPSLLLLISTVLLTCELGKARKAHNAVAARTAKKTDDAERAARMLIIVAIFTLLSELPQGKNFLKRGFLCSSILFFPIGFQWHYVDRLTRLWVLIQLISTSCNLIIYLAMSKNFRKAVFSIFCFWWKRKAASPSASVISVSTVVKVNSERF